MGGLDGHLHELCYANAASMFSRRCYQVRMRWLLCIAHLPLVQSTLSVNRSLPHTACGSAAALPSHVLLVQRDLTAGLSQFLPSFVPRLWSKPSPVAELALDAYRHILYLRLQSGAVQVPHCSTACQ